MKKRKGTLIPIGGNEDKGEVNEDEGLDYIEEGILSRVVKESGGREANIIVIPTASSIPEQVGENYIDAFGKLGCSNVTVLNLIAREQCEEQEKRTQYLELRLELEAARGASLGGAQEESERQGEDGDQA